VNRRQRSPPLRALRWLFGWSLPLYVDSMADELNTRYAIWPERAIILRDRRLVFDSGSTEGITLGGTDHERIAVWLAQQQQQQQQQQ